MTTKKFLLHLGLMALVFFGLIQLILFGLRIYTNHGQKLEMPNLVEQQIDDAAELARRKSFRVVVIDSVHKINVPGGKVLRQNPPAGSFVKENRTVYLTISKYKPDFLLTEQLPNFYGHDFEMKKRELNNLSISANVDSYQFDPKSEDNTILSASYKGKKIIINGENIKGLPIDKGETIDFVLSTSEGGEIEIPNLVCNTLAEAEFLLSYNKLEVGNIVEEGDIQDIQGAYITRQVPEYRPGAAIKMGSGIVLYVSPQKPLGCQ